MRKKFAAGLLALCMALTLLPGGALAYDPQLPVGEELPDYTEPFQGEDPWDAPPSGPDPGGLDDDDPIPEFVPGVVPEDEELIYPDYAYWGDAMADGLPASYDTRSLYQTPTKNQGANGLCWAFGSMATLEAHMKMNGMGEHDFAELHMAYSLSSTSGNAQQGITGRLPHAGGNRYYSSSYLMRNTDLSGTVDEASDPYITAKIGERDLDISRIKEKTYQVRNILFLTGRRDEESFSMIKQAVQVYGGVGASIYWQGQTTAEDGESKQYFFNDEHDAYCYDYTKDNNEGHPTDSGGTNHAIEIVGWDDNYPRENFNAITRPQNNGAWLIKNSWGAKWGDGGYAWVSYEDTNFPNNAYCFDGVKTYDPSSIVYETDYVSTGYSIGFVNTYTCYFAKSFTKETDGPETLRSVRLFIPNPYSSIQVGCHPSGQLEGYQFKSLGGAESDDDMNTFFPGWYTIDLDQPVTIEGEKGTQFTIPVKITGLDGSSTSKMGYSHVNGLGSSQVYHSFNGSRWYESSADYNYCIKAVTEPVTQQAQGQAIVDKAAQSLCWTLIRGENESQDSISSDLNLPARFKGADITWRSTDSNVISPSGSFRQPISDADQPVTLTAVLSAGGASAEVVFNLTASHITQADYDAVNAAAARITWDLIRGENASQSSVSTNLDLSFSGTQSDGVTVTWTSSNTDIIQTDGTVTLPRFDKRGAVTLTAAVTKSTLERVVTFNLSVPNRTATYADRKAAAWEYIGKFDRWFDLVRGENTSLNAIRYDLVVPKGSIRIPAETGDFYVDIVGASAKGVEKDENGKDIQVPWSCVTNEGKVTRPAYGQPDSKGLFFLKMSAPDENGNTRTESLSSYYPVVLAYKGRITVQSPGDVMAPSEEGAVLTVSASVEGEPGGALQYQWYWSYSTDESSWRKAEGMTTPQFRVSPNSSGTIYVRCEVSALDAAPVWTDPAKVELISGAFVARADPSDPKRATVYNLPAATAAMYAARYDSSGRLLQVVSAQEWARNSVLFSADVGSGWKLFCLDGGKSPLKESILIS